MEIVTGYIEKNTKDREEKEKELGGKSGLDKGKENEVHDDNEKGKNNWKLIPVFLLIGVVSIGLGSCSHQQQVVKVVKNPIRWEYYKTGNSSEQAHGIQQREGQEELHSAATGRSGNYDSDKAFYDEKESAGNAEKFEISQNEVENKARQLIQNGKEDDDRQLLEEINEELENMNESYKILTPKVEEYAEGYREAINKYPDSNTLIEEKVINIAEKEFMDDSKLAEENYNGLKEITDKEGKLNIEEVQVDKDGDIKISGNEINQIVEKETTRGIKAAYRHFRDFIKMIKENIKGLFKGNDGNQR